MVLYIIDEREGILRHTVAYRLNEFISHHFVGFSYLLVVSFEIGLDVLLEHALVQRLEVLVGVQLTEDLFIRDTSESPQFLQFLVFQVDLAWNRRFHILLLQTCFKLILKVLSCFFWQCLLVLGAAVCSFWLFGGSVADVAGVLVVVPPCFLLGVVDFGFATVAIAVLV